MTYAVPPLPSPAAGSATAEPRVAAAQPAFTIPAHLPALDGLRGLAIMLVLAHNLTLVNGPVSGIAATAMRYLLDWGWVGVQLFFVLSGFLITGVLLETRASPHYFRNFYGRRALRIFPLYYGVLALLLVVLPRFVRLPPLLDADRHHQFWLWAYLSNWTIPFGGAGMGLPHFWSLAVEEQFYLVWPWLLRWRDPVRALRLCVVVAVVALAARCTLLVFGAPPETLYSFTVCRMDALAIGGAAAALLRLPRWRDLLPRSAGRLALAAGLFTVVELVAMHGFGRLGPGNQTLGYSIGAVVFGLLVLAAAAGDCADRPFLRKGAASGATGVSGVTEGQGWSWRLGWLSLLRAGPLRSVGKYSYAMYVFHKPLHDYVVLPWLTRLGWDPAAASVWWSSAYVLGMTIAVYLLAVLSYHGFEIHFLALKRRLSAA